MLDRACRCPWPFCPRVVLTILFFLALQQHLQKHLQQHTIQQQHTTSTIVPTIAVSAICAEMYSTGSSVTVASACEPACSSIYNENTRSINETNQQPFNHSNIRESLNQWVVVMGGNHGERDCRLIAWTVTNFVDRHLFVGRWSLFSSLSRTFHSSEICWALTKMPVKTAVSAAVAWINTWPCRQTVIIAVHEFSINLTLMS